MKSIYPATAKQGRKRKAPSMRNLQPKPLVKPLFDSNKSSAKVWGLAGRKTEEEGRHRATLQLNAGK